jgi:seryl-tRNA synthetase
MVNKQIPTEEGELIKQGPELEVTRAIGSIDDLFESEIMGEFVKNSGQYLILPKGAMVLNGLKNLLVEYVRDSVGFEEVVLPKIAPVDSFRKADILGRWDDYLISAKPFSRTNGVKEEYIMDSLQCTVFYQFHENKRVDVGRGPRKWYDHSGPTYRNEDSNKIVPSVKQREFHRAEFIYLGTREQVIETREKCLAQLEKLCVDLGLKYRIVVGSECYRLKDGEIKMPESSEEIPIKDLEIYCPGYSNKDGEPYLEVGGSSILANTMTSKFNINGKNGEELWSGCTGIGLNRLMYAVISNHGTDLEKMPSKIQEAIR